MVDDIHFGAGDFVEGCHCDRHMPDELAPFHVRQWDCPPPKKGVRLEVTHVDEIAGTVHVSVVPDRRTS